MSAATVEVGISITCPAWCTVSPEHHAENLWNMGGVCIHHSAEVVVEDPTGHREGMEEPRFHQPMTVALTTETNPEGREVASPAVRVDGHECTVEQALKLADTIRRVVGAVQQEQQA